HQGERPRRPLPARAEPRLELPRAEGRAPREPLRALPRDHGPGRRADRAARPAAPRRRRALTEGEAVPVPVVHVAVAVIERGGRYLLRQRPPGGHLAGLWEFPGGKLEQG